MPSIERSLGNQKMSDPTELTFLISRFQQLSTEARKCLQWAAFFGERLVIDSPKILVLNRYIHSFKLTELTTMLDWEESSGTSGSDDDIVDADMSGFHKAVTNREPRPLTSQKAMEGLQTALKEGWLITKSRDMCSFAHDRYRQAALVVVESLSPATIAKMSLKVGSWHLLVILRLSLITRMI